jgi:mono/diheme cytochrome c family protein
MNAVNPRAALQPRSSPMPIQHKGLIIVFNFLIHITTLVIISRADANEKGIGTSFQKAPPKMVGLKNPYAGSLEEAGKAGQKLFKRHCASCHEKNESAVNSAPALNTPALRTIPAGHLFWYLKNGNLRRGMPAWSSLPDQRLWQLVTYLQQGDSNQGVASGRIR